jgi:glutamyl-tRNA reductase
MPTARASYFAKPAASKDRLSIKSGRLSKINHRISTELESFPLGITKQQITKAINILDSSKESKSVQKVLKDYAEGDRSKLPIDEYVTSLVNDTTDLGLLSIEKAQADSLRLCLDAILLRVDSNYLFTSDSELPPANP